MKQVIVIPARMGSTRFPGKPLCDILGKPMLQWVIEAAYKVKSASEIIVATPDQEIIDFTKKLEVQGVFTSSKHLNGTDRISEIAEKIAADIYINVQGDEPLVKPETIEACIEPMLIDEKTTICSLYSECFENDFNDSSIVKVVNDQFENALYFSRYPIPFYLSPKFNESVVYKHIGLCAYSRDALLKYSRLKPGPLELAESIEFMRFLEYKIPIRMRKAIGTPVAVNTPEEAELVRNILLSYQK